MQQRFYLVVIMTSTKRKGNCRLCGKFFKCSLHCTKIAHTIYDTPFKYNIESCLCIKCFYKENNQISSSLHCWKDVKELEKLVIIYSL
jgi:hypothetical protein